MKVPQKQGLYDPSREHDNCGIGLIVDMKGRKSHDIVSGALEICVNLDHRGGCGCDPITGDGAGIFIQKPHKFFSKVIQDEQSIGLPVEGDYGVGFFYLSKEDQNFNKERDVIDDVLSELSLKLICVRDVPVKSSILGKASAACEPRMQQFFVERPEDCERGLPFERKLYLARRMISYRLRYASNVLDADFHASSFSSRTLVYKGMLTTEQLSEYFPDLSHPDMESALALSISFFDEYIS